MTVQETIKYIQSMKHTAENDKDNRAAKCIEAMDSVLKLINDRRALQNRCYVCTGMGAMCRHCGMECEHRGNVK